METFRLRRRGRNGVDFLDESAVTVWTGYVVVMYPHTDKARASVTPIRRRRRRRHLRWFWEEKNLGKREIKNERVFLMNEKEKVKKGFIFKATRGGTFLTASVDSHLRV